MYIADCPAGSVTRIKDLGPYDFPASIKEFSRKFIPVLAFVWQPKPIMKATLATVNDGEKVVLPSVDGSDRSSSPQCMPSPKAGSKRKLAGTNNFTYQDR